MFSHRKICYKRCVVLFLCSSRFWWFFFVSKYLRHCVRISFRFLWISFSICVRILSQFHLTVFHLVCHLRFFPNFFFLQTISHNFICSQCLFWFDRWMSVIWHCNDNASIAIDLLKIWLWWCSCETIACFALKTPLVRTIPATTRSTRSIRSA